MKAARARLMKDKPVIGEGMPMLSASETPINLGDVLYTIETNFYAFDRDEDDEDEPGDGINGLKIIAHRVIQLNYQHRYVRIRCANGCEDTLHYSEGCGKARSYHNLKDAQEAIRERIRLQAKREKDKAEKHTDKAKRLQKAIAEVSKIPVRIPKAV